jgi:hypothetical protein
MWTMKRVGVALVVVGERFVRGNNDLGLDGEKVLVRIERKRSVNS